jgi:hypothetical protein
MKLVSVVYRTFIDFVRRIYKISNSTSRNTVVKSAKLVATLNLYSAVLLISFTMSFNIFLQSEVMNCVLD